MRKLIIHAGPPKTGSTAIQYCLARNRDQLQKLGLLYPRAGCPWVRPRFGHHLLVWAFTGDRGTRSGGSWRNLLREIQASPAETVVLSSEGFSLLQDEHVAKVRDYLREFDDVEVVVYLRDQLKFMISLYKQRIKADGCALSFIEFAEETLWRADYQALIERWGGAFGEDVITVRVYDKIKRPPGVVGDFISLLKPEVASLASDPSCCVTANVAQPNRNLVVMHKLNRRAAACGSLNPWRYALTAARYAVRARVGNSVTARIGDAEASEGLFPGDSIARVRETLEPISEHFLKGGLVAPEDRKYFMNTEQLAVEKG